MSSVIYAKRFLDVTASLAPHDRKIIDNTVMEFARGSTAKGLRLHKLKCREKRFHSISANKDLRIIVYIDGDARVVMHAGHHDAAYRWAERHEVRNHEITQVPQIIEFVESIEERIVFSSEANQNSPIFENVNDDLLAALGIPSDYITLVRRVNTEDDLEKLSGTLPEEAWEALVDIAAGADPSDLESMVLESDVVEGQTAVSNSLKSSSFTSQAARRRFWVAESEEELEQALSMPWAVWRVFLHPSQAKAVAADHAGPARVSGGAGTGKSVVLVHRAVRLARASSSTRVLLSTFSKVLANHLNRSVDELLGNDHLLRERIEVTHLHEHAFLAVRSSESGVSIATAADLKTRIDAAMTAVGYLARPSSFLRDEWNHVIDYWGVESLASYLGVARTGRGKALPRVQREVLWPVFQHVLNGLTKHKSMTRAAICQHASDSDCKPRIYDHVLLDEAQDFGPRELRYAQSLATGNENGLFLGGDDGQRIYRNPFPLKSVGINIRGRSRRLRVNYRTSAEIHDFSVKMLPEELIDDDLVGSRRITSLFSGAQPEIVSSNSRQAEARQVLQWIAKCQEDGVTVGEIAILARQPSRLDELLATLLESGKSFNKLIENDGQSLIVDTLHAAKGLEFRAVIVVGAEEGSIPLSTALDGEPGDDAHSLAIERERHLLYVGCTRARERLLISYLGKISRFLPAGDGSNESIL